jgi:DNA methylase N-4/N-6
LTLATDFDRDKIQKELMELKNLDFDISILGFEEKELEDLVKEIDFQPVSEEEQPRLDKLDPKYITCPHCGEVFDAREQE